MKLAFTSGQGACGRVAALAPLAPLAALLLSAFVLPAAAQEKSWKSHVSPNEPAAIFRQHCAVCHGEKGNGDTLAKYALDPPPADFTSDKTRRELSRAHMIETLNKGAVTEEGEPTAMIPWASHLSKEQIEAVVDYVIVAFMDGKVLPNEQEHGAGHKHEGHNHSASHIKPVDYPYGLKPNAARGKAVFAANCQACHGAQGDGRGDPKRIASIKPRNFHDTDFARFATGFTLYSAVTKGRGHMPAWDKKLSNQEIADVSEYVLRTFVKPQSAQDGGQAHEHHAHEHQHQHPQKK